MSFRTDILKLVDPLRAIAGAALDWRTCRLSIVTRTWTGPRSIQGVYADTTLVVRPRDNAGQPAGDYKVRLVSAREVASSGGRYEADDLIVGPITPAYPGGGYTTAQLAPRPTSANVEILYVITGAHPGEYEIRELRDTKASKYELVLRRRRSTP